MLKQKCQAYVDFIFEGKKIWIRITVIIIVFVRNVFWIYIRYRPIYVTGEILTLASHVKVKYLTVRSKGYPCAPREILQFWGHQAGAVRHSCYTRFPAKLGQRTMHCNGWPREILLFCVANKLRTNIICPHFVGFLGPSLNFDHFTGIFSQTDSSLTICLACLHKSHNLLF